MNIQRVTLVTGLCAALALPAAMAADGQIEFAGEINGTTCKINGDQPDFQVDLPAVSRTALAVVGQGAGRTPFDIKLTECDADVRVATYFEPGPTVNPVTGRLVIDTGADQATNVEVALLNDRFGKIELGKPFAEQNSQIVDIVSGSATLDYYAEYVRATTNAVGPGEVKTRIQYSIVYP